jgi:hypothetical protein
MVIKKNTIKNRNFVVAVSFRHMYVNLESDVTEESLYHLRVEG